MNDEKWEDVKVKVAERFTVIEKGARDLEPGTAEFLVFETPQGKVKLERVKRPVKLGEKGIVSKRIGAHAVIESVYSDTETAQSFHVYRFDVGTGAWQEVRDPSAFGVV